MLHMDERTESARIGKDLLARIRTLARKDDRVLHVALATIHATQLDSLKGKVKSIRMED